MPSIRVGFSSDFTLGNQLVGVGTTSAVRRLNVIGAIKGDFETLGVSTLSVYEGFVPEFQNVSFASTIGFSTSGVGTFVQVTESETGYLSLTTEFNSVSEDIVVDEGRIFEVSIGSTATLGSLESISVQSNFSVPNGGTSTRPADPVEGMVRFNDDLNTLEFWNGFEWRQFTVTGASGRGVFAGTGPSPITQEIDYVNITTTGNTTNFGRLSSLGGALIRGCSSSIRGVYGLGTPAAPAPTKSFMEYVTIASEGNAINFGNLTGDSLFAGGMLSSSTRGVIHESANPTASSNVISYIEIATLGNALDFGDMNTAIRHLSGFSSPTRGIFTGGYVNPTGNINFNQYVTIASKGNALVFGDMTKRLRGAAGFSNSVRGCYGGGVDSPTNTIQNSIDYVTIATTGNAVDFGDLTAGRRTEGGGCSTQIRGIFAGGYSPTNVNTIDYITIASQGNAIDFGDRSTLGGTSACSDSHGGLGGF